MSGYTNAFPRSCVALYDASIAGDVETAVPLYRALHPLLRWDSKPEFVQAIKLSMDVVGRHGGPCRPPRGRLDDDTAPLIRGLTEKAVAEGVREGHETGLSGQIGVRLSDHLLRGSVRRGRSHRRLANTSKGTGH